MTLAQGTRLGPYRIEAPIGAGGMGAVYRAHDTRLDRTVAIKVLSSELAGDAQLRLRFEREAKTISSLNHPNICTLFDVGQARVDSADGGEDVHYLVMEHIEGETLADRLVKGPLPIDEVIRRGSEIADALDRAHRHGIVHRDIKPGNIMLTRSGAKLLDFGLSRHQADAPQVSTDDFTAHKALTMEGTILGTWLYMAPEQLDGAAADARTDIFAFGCVLYEMTTGRRAFEGKSRSSLIAAIITSQPRPLSEFQPLAPPALEQIIRKCLEKDPEERWQSIRDLRSALQWLGDAGSQAGVPKAIIGARKRSKRLLAAIALAGWTVAAGAAVWTLTHGAGEPALLRSEVVIPRAVGVDVVIKGAAVLSPGGDRVAFRASTGEFPLAIRDLVSGETRLIEGTGDAMFPFWSPDGRWVGFFSDSKLKKVEARGGPVQTLCEAPDGRGGAWSKAGWIVLAPDIDGPLLKVSENGGRPEAVTVAAAGVTHRNPFFLADGRRFLFTARDTNKAEAEASARVMLGGHDDRSSREIVVDGSNPQAAGGYLLFSRDGNLIAQRFDEDKATVSGPLVPIAEAIEYYNPRDLANYSVSMSGSLLYRKLRLPPRELVWFSRDGRELERVSEPAHVEEATLARDGRTVVTIRSDVRGNARDIWLYALDRRQSTRSTFISTSGIVHGVLSPDGERLAAYSYAAAGIRGGQVWIQKAGGAGTEQAVLDRGNNWLLSDWSPDGRYLIGSTQAAGTLQDISWIALAAPGKINRFLSSRFDEAAGKLSPDGRWLTWSSNASGKVEAYVGEFPTGNRTSQISQGVWYSPIADEVPRWNSNGRELVYREAGGAWVSVGVTAAEGNLRFDMPVRLPLPTAGTILVGAVGDRYLLLRDIATEEQPLRLVQNWTRSLER